jgi:NAD(P)-dependent dehydrogenase (short-subunit alcohol dehydrogenase family)
MQINGISAIVTGGASGIGEACARQLAAAGAKVLIADVNDEKGNALASEIGGAFAHVDVTNTDDIIAAVETAMEMGPLRALVNSAGIGAASRTIGRDGSYDSAFNLDYWRKVIDINLTGTFDVIRIAATAMSRTEPLEGGERGSIVNMASVAAFDGQIGQAAYSASKAAAISCLESLRVELHGSGVAVVTLCPGFVATPLTAKNDFPMPFLMVPEAAAKRIAEGLATGHFEVRFPRRLAWLLGLMAALPYPLYFALTKRMLRPA